MGDESEKSGYDPTYRQEDVDDILKDHDSRITRLERGGLVLIGYLLGFTAVNAGEIVQFFIGAF